VAQGHDDKTMAIPIEQAGLTGNQFITDFQNQGRQCDKADPSEGAPITGQAEPIKSQQAA
jgi:hypothetical protein